MKEKRSYSESEVSAFIQKWTPQLLYRGFSQVWKDTETGELINFSKIGDLDELREKNARAEAQYLKNIADARMQYVEMHKDAPEEAVKEFERELCKIDPYYLGKYWLGYNDAVFHLHYFMANTVAPDRVGQGYRGLREFARDCYKTTFMGVTFCVQRIICNPDVSILYKSNAADNASKKLQEIKNHFILNKRFYQLFPEHHPSKVADEGSGTGWRSPARGKMQAENTITSAGVGSSKGGTSQHYDIIIGDDFWDERSVTSDDKVEKVKKEMAGIEYLLASPEKGIVMYIGTRFSHDDPTTALENMREYECIIVSGILQCGRSIFPESLSLQKYIDQSQVPYAFSCQVILNPTEESRGFKREWFRYRRWSDCLEDEKKGRAAYRKVILTDAAGDDKTGSDPIAVITVAADDKGNFYIADYIQQKMAPAEFVDLLFQQWDRWHPEYIVRQKTLLETTIMSFVERKNRERIAEGKESARFYDYSLGKREKKQRITAALQPIFANGRMFFDPDIPDLHYLERALLEHPRSNDDNGPDSLSLLDDPAVSSPACLKSQPDSTPPDMSQPTPDERSSIEMMARREAARLVFESRKNAGLYEGIRRWN